MQHDTTTVPGTCGTVANYIWYSMCCVVGAIDSTEWSYGQPKIQVCVHVVLGM